MFNHRHSPRAIRCGHAAAAALALCLLTGCGTNLKYLLAEEGRLTAEADELITIAEAMGTGLEEPLYAAEEGKREACKFLHDAAMERFARDYGFREQFVSDFSQVVALIVPVGQVERCREAIETYKEAIATLERQLAEQGGLPGATNTEADGSN
ncbi:MAG: hypothetical protein ACREE7_16560 [Dongiaceae bacterium]